MPSSYSTNLKIELQATGENSGTWGTITNTNLGTALEQAIVGYGNPNYLSDANLTLTYTDTNAAQAARALVLNVTSALSLTGTRELVVPTIQKQYIVQNNTTGSQSITVKTSGGTGITVPNGRKAHLYVDGTNVIYMDDYVDINGGAIDGTPIGANSASTGAFSTLSATGNVNFDGGTFTFNDSGADRDFRVEGDTDANLLFSDASTDRIGIGTNTPASKLDVNGTITATAVNTTTLDLTNLEVTNIKAKDGTSAASIADSTGVVSFTANPILSGGTANGVLYLNGSKVATSGSVITYNGTTFGVDSAAVFNDSGADVDFRVEGDTDTNLLFVDASTDSVGVGTNDTRSAKTRINFPAAGEIKTVAMLSNDTSANATAGQGVRLYLSLRDPSAGPRGAFIDALYTDGTNGTALAFSTSSSGAVPAERMRITSAGELLVNGTTAIPTYGITGVTDTPKICIEGTATPGIGIFRNDTSIVSPNVIGAIAFYGNDTTSNIVTPLANIYAAASGTHAAGDNPTDLVFGTTADGTETVREVMRINQAGNLGLGVTPSAWWSSGKVIQVGVGTSVVDTTTQALFGHNWYYDGTNVKYIANGFASYIEQTSGQHRWYTAPSGTAGNTITFTQAMTLDASGNLGVGVTDPASYASKGVFAGHLSVTSANKLKLWDSTNGSLVGISCPASNTMAFYTADAGTERARITSGGDFCVGSTSPGNAGTINVSVGNPGTTIGGLQLWSTTSGSSWVQFGDSTSSSDPYRGAVGYSHASDALLFYTAAAERARITSGGEFLIGTTTTAGSSGVGVKLHPTGGVYAVSTTSISDNYNYYNETAGAYRFYVTNGGTIFATNTTISAISDQRLKENVRDLDAGLAEVMALKPRKFDWKEGKGKDKKDDRGFIAQEFEQVFPDLIDTWKDPAPEGEEPYKSVRQDLIPVLVKAIQEQQAMIKSLEAKVAALESK